MERRPVEEAGKMTTWYKLQADKGEIFDWETISSSWKRLEGEEMGNFVPQHGPAVVLKSSTDLIPGISRLRMGSFNVQSRNVA